MENKFKCCFTGYRPSKMPFCKNTEGSEYLKFENTLIKQITELIKDGCYTFYSGMAMGFDIIAAETVLMLKNIYSDIKLVSVLPFENQQNTFSVDWEIRFNKILENCDEKIVLSNTYFSGCYQKRNIYMVDNCDYVLTWFDGKSGGTKNTLDYARKKGRYIFNINDKYDDYKGFQQKIEI